MENKENFIWIIITLIIPRASYSSEQISNNLHVVHIFCRSVYKSWNERIQLSLS